MARPPAKELTERELEVMHVFWQRGNSTVAEVREALAEAGLDRAYTTVATLVRILADKNFLHQTNQERPFSYQPVRSYQEVSKKLLGELIDRVFHGSREQLLVRLLEHKSLTAPSVLCCKTSCVRRRNEVERHRFNTSEQHRPRDGVCIRWSNSLPCSAAHEPGGRRWRLGRVCCSWRSCPPPLSGRGRAGAQSRLRGSWRFRRPQFQTKP